MARFQIGSHDGVRLNAHKLAKQTSYTLLGDEDKRVVRLLTMRACRHQDAVAKPRQDERVQLL